MCMCVCVYRDGEFNKDYDRKLAVKVSQPLFVLFSGKVGRCFEMGEGGRAGGIMGYGC